MTNLQDLQLENPKRPGVWIFLNSRITTTTPGNNRLRFAAQWLKWDDERQANVKLDTEQVTSDQFSDWWLKQANAGWKIVI